MITSIPDRSASAKDLLDYLEGRDAPRGHLVDTNLAGESTAAWAIQIKDIATIRPRASPDYVKHLILSFAPGEQLEDEDLVSISRYYLGRMGFAEAPYVAYLHTDREHWHIHIVTTLTTFDGKAISECWDWRRSEEVARDIETLWGLTPVPSSHKTGLASASTEERGAAARALAPSARTLFQYEIATQAAESRSFVELLERLDARGFAVRVALDKSGQPRGLSFARDGFSFRGSELGRDFSGSRILRAYGLDYQPGRDAPAVAAFQVRNQQRGEVVAESTAPPHDLREILAVRLEHFAPDASSRHDESLRLERGRLARDLARLEANPVVTARELESLPRPVEARPLPAGSYALAAVKPEALQGRDGWIRDEDLRVLGTSWTTDQLEAALPSLEREQVGRDLLLRPRGNETTVIGFRGVEESQLDRLRAAGFEPTMAVRMGDRYDVLLAADRIFNSGEYEMARVALAERFGLTVSRGVFRDAVHAPGSMAHVSGRREEAVLVEVRAEPFSASPELLAEARRRAAEGEIEHEARAWSLPRGQEDAPAVVAAEALRDREAPRADVPERLAWLQEAIDEQRREPQRRSAELAPLTLGELRERIADENRTASEETRSGIESLRAAAAGSSRLLGLERELTARRHEAEALLGQAETRFGEALRALADSQAQALPGASPAEPARALAEAVSAWREAERQFLSHVAAQAESDTARLGRYAESEHGNAVRAAYAWTIERRAELSARRGEPATVPATVPASPAGPVRSVAERIEGELRQRVEQTRDAARAGTLPVRATNADDPRLAHLFAVHARDVARGSAEAALRVEPGEARGRLRDAAERIALGDLSPDALRRAASAALETRPEVALSPSRNLPRAPDALAERYSSLSSSLREQSRAIHQSADSAKAPALDRFFNQASEMVRLHQRIEALERKQLGLPEPRLDAGPNTAARALAWLSLAMSKGLEPAQAAGHLANATRATFLAVGSANARVAASLARSVAHQALSASLEHVRRVMHS